MTQFDKIFFFSFPIVEKSATNINIVYIIINSKLGYYYNLDPSGFPNETDKLGQVAVTYY